MIFSEKLQQLRKQKGLTQEELAQALYVSRTAVSKWESGRGYPSIDSLKDISAFFGVSIDNLLSAEKLLDAARQDSRRKIQIMQNRLSAVLDSCAFLLFLLPVFGQQANGSVISVQLLKLSGISPQLRTAYICCTAAVGLWGILSLYLHRNENSIRIKYGHWVSIALGAVATIIFILGRQPYPAILMLVSLLVKAISVTKKQ